MRIRTIAGLAVLSANLAARVITSPRPHEMSACERLDMLPARDAPVGEQVVIRWSEHQVPFIEASSDRDLAVALGLVHAHLRIAQMEMLRRLSQGRLSELVGPVAIDLDHLLRIVDFGRAVPGILADLPPETGQWLEGFVAGINHYVDHAAERPHELDVLGLPREPWTVADVLRIGRLAAVDINWLVHLGLLKLRGHTEWPRLWRRLGGKAVAPEPGPIASSPRSSQLAIALRLLGRGASNSAAVAARRSASGGALIANDPHLGIHLPGPWLIAAYRSPGHHAVGLMAPALPFIALGRNPWIAWGGTNLVAASSDFYDVSSLPGREITERRDVIRTRWWPDREIVLRDSPLGPVISDARLLGLDRHTPIALRWMGHQPSDEITAMLRVGQSRGRRDFRSAIDGIAVSGQTMTYADARGHVGRAMAARLPKPDAGALRELLLDPAQTNHWQRCASASDLSADFDPRDGIVVSANERPDECGVVVGHFFLPPDRSRRLRALIGSDAPISGESLKQALDDVYVATSHDLAREFLRQLPGRDGRPPSGIQACLAQWDGRYEACSVGALAFELVFHFFVEDAYSAVERQAYWATWEPRAMVLDDLARGRVANATTALRRALVRAGRPFRRYRTWGAMHRLRLAHPFALVPGLARRYVFADLPSAGGTDSVHVTAHGRAARRHAASYGIGARHICDLSDLDRNEFILLGGQDGWLGSANFADQLALWRTGVYLAAPLRPETARDTFPFRTDILAKAGR